MVTGSSQVVQKSTAGHNNKQCIAHMCEKVGYVQLIDQRVPCI